MTATMESSVSTIAGWYPDPADDAGLRWWDGTAWTAETRSSAPGPSSVAGSTSGGLSADPDRPLTRRELRERETASAEGGSALPAPVRPLFDEVPGMSTMPGMPSSARSGLAAETVADTHARGPVPVEGAAVGIGGAFGAAQGAAPDAIDGAGTAGRSPG
ncbi:MAG: hypothetical protein RI885_826, partial [Actinomycetota bacterium]